MPPVREILTAILLLTGATLAFLASVGVFRMPDLFTRMQTATKAAALGTGLMLLAVAVHFGELGVTTRALATVGFVIITAPLAAHMLARAAWLAKVPQWEHTVVDEWREQRGPGDPPPPGGPAAPPPRG